MKLYLIRHGESEANLKQMHAGWQDSPLTGKGELQALAVQPIIKNVQFDKIIVSDLSRAKRTAHIIFRNSEISLSSEIREINMDKISGLSYDELINKYGERYLQCRERWDFSPLGCESFSDFSKRIDSFFDRLIEEYGQTSCNIALVTHAGVIRYLAGKVVDISFSDRYSLKIDNSSVCVLSYDYKKGLQIEHWNYTPSL